MNWYRARFLAAALFAALCPASSQEGTEPIVRCLNISQGEVKGALVSLSQGQLLLRTSATELTPFALESFREVLFESPALAATAPLRMRLKSGTDLRVQTLAHSPTPASLTLRGAGWEASGVPLSELEAIAAETEQAESFQEARGEMEAALRRARRERDEVMVLRDGRAVPISCAVESVSPTGVTISTGGAAGEISWPNVLWVVFASGVGAAGPTEEQWHTVEVADGSRARVETFELEAEMLRGRAGPATFIFAVRHVRRIQVSSDAYQYLSDLTPEAVQMEPFIDTVWLPRMDRSVTGRPLTLAGQAYAKGIGMYARTAMKFRVNGRYSRLLATIGVDSAASGQGSVVFRVLSDEQEVYRSGPLRAGTAVPLEVQLGAAHSLTLVADFGGPLEAAGNFADWAEARLVK